MTENTTHAPGAHSPSTTDRRSLLGAIPEAAAVAAIPGAAIATASANDSAIIAAWERRNNTQAQFNVLPFDDHPDYEDVYRPEEKRLWAIIGDAEEVIRSQVAHTPQGVGIQIMVALLHTMLDRADEQGLLSGNVTALMSRDREQDWNTRLMLAALRSLKAMEA